jgi:multiple sugar transport system substrate-binding protein
MSDQSRNRAGVRRRGVLAGAGALAALPSVAVPARAQAAFDWKKHSGTTIRVLANRIPPGDLLLKQIPEFEAKTGIKVNVQSLPEEQFRQRIVVEMTAGNSDIDAFMTLIGNEGTKFLKAGWYEPVKKYLDNPALTAPDFNAADIGQGAWESQTVFGTLIATPIEVGGHCLMVNKTLLQQAGVAAPRTLDEMEAAAKKLTDKSKEIYGVSLRGRRGQAVGIFSNFLHNMGGAWLDKDENPTINTPEAIAAFELYGRLLREYGPPGSANHTFTEVNALLMAGKAALVVEGTVFAGFYEDASKSRVAGQIGYVPMPTGPGGDHPVVNGWGVAMYSGSKKKEAAWYFMQWSSSKETLLGLAMGGQGSPRASVWNDPQFKSASNSPPDWRETLLHTVKVGTPLFAPPVIPVLEVRDYIGDVIVESINGGNVKAAANRANDQFKKALAENK